MFHESVKKHIQPHGIHLVHPRNISLQEAEDLMEARGTP